DPNRIAAPHGSAFILALTCFLGSYFLGYFALAYSGKWIFRRFAFHKILQEVVLSSSKAVREQKLAEQAHALRGALVTHQTTYATSWRRLGAYVLDLGLFMAGLVAFVVGLVICVTYAQAFMNSLPLFVSVGVLLFPFIAYWLYQVMMLSSRRQATLGKLALGIFVTDHRGDRLHFGWATARHFAKVLSYLTLGIGFFIQRFTRNRQTLHDLIVSSVVLIRPDKKTVQKWIVVLCVIIGLMEASLVSLIPIGLIAANRQVADLQKAADQGNADAQNKLGVRYQTGRGVPKDL